MRYVHSQSGAALIILLTIFILGSVTFLLSQLNERTHYLLDDQDQTIRVLTQAKESLLGFAGTYAQNHKVKLQGYLPCPDKDGDGSAEPPCSGEGQTVIGRFPWRTLGIPPLRDGSGECLWYAVSGNFKDLPKQVLTSDSNGLIVIRNAKNDIITGNPPSERAIAVIFAPGRFTKDQTREVTTGTSTECGSKIEGSIIDPINNVRNYLDKYNFEGVVLDNPTANNAIFISPTSGFFASSPLIPNVTPEFINAPPVYETYLHPQDNTEQLDRANPTFNDTLIAITPEDFKPIYRMMDYQVATQVRACFDRYAQKSWYYFIDWLQTDIDLTAERFIFVDEFLKVTKLPKENATTEEINQEKIRILSEIKKSLANKTIPYPKYPWPSYINPYDYTNDENNYFGRVPTPISVASPAIITPPYLAKTRDAIIKLFEADIIKINNLSYFSYNSVFKPQKLDVLWETFEKYINILINQSPEGKQLLNLEWPVNPQMPWLILDLHPLEYKVLKDNSVITLEEIRKNVLATLEEPQIVMAFAKHYNISPTDPFETIKNNVITRINNLTDKNSLIADIEVVIKQTTVLSVLSTYRCFNSSSDLNSWGWWSDWQDKVFFAIHSDYSFNNSTTRRLTFSTPTDKDIIQAEMLVLVAGRSLTGQQRDSVEQKIEITNYLEDQNRDGDNHFVHAPVTSIFNDVVL